MTDKEMRVILEAVENEAAKIGVTSLEFTKGWRDGTPEQKMIRNAIIRKSHIRIVR